MFTFLILQIEEDRYLQLSTQATEKQTTLDSHLPHIVFPLSFFLYQFLSVSISLTFTCFLSQTFFVTTSLLLKINHFCFPSENRLSLYVPFTVSAINDFAIIYLSSICICSKSSSIRIFFFFPILCSFLLTHNAFHCTADCLTSFVCFVR